MTLRITKKQFFYFGIILGINILGSVVLHALSTPVDYTTVARNSLIAIAIIAFEYYNFVRLCRWTFPYYSIFLIAFIIFHFGLFWVYSIGGNYNFFYLKQYGPGLLINAIEYEFKCVGALFLSGALLPTITPLVFSRMNSIEENRVYVVANTFRVLTEIAAYILIVMKLMYFSSGHYSGVRAFESRVPSIVGLIEYFYIPFSILTLIYSKNENEKKRIIMLVTAWSLATALCGDRTTGIAGIIIMYLIDVRYGKSSQSKKCILSIAVMALTIFLIAFIRVFREGNAFSLMGIFSIMNNVFGELGSSFFPLVLIMRVCPSSHSFLYGKSYFFSLISAFIPESIDFTGLITKWTTLSIEPVHWISNDYEYTFGTGYSLCAESYANFGFAGFIVLFFIGLIIVKLLQNDQDNKFSLYSSAVLMFEFFTLPRRNFYYVINHLFYCIVMMSIVILLLAPSRRRAKGGGESFIEWNGFWLTPYCVYNYYVSNIIESKTAISIVCFAISPKFKRRRLA